MTINEVVQLLNASLPTPLTPIQELVLRQAWEGKTYASMAQELHYGSEYLRKVASGLWQMLSDVWEEPIAKNNIRQILEPRPFVKSQLASTAGDRLSQASLPSLEFPSGPVALDSEFYIPRPPIEQLAYAEVAKPGGMIRIKAPWKMGKTSLMLRILDRAASLGYRTVTVDFLQADTATLTNLNQLLRWFCANIAQQLQLPLSLDHYWVEEIGPKVNCSIYFQTYLLERLPSSLVLALNEVNRVFEYPEIAQDFLPLLRFWHEQSKKIAIWAKLRLVVVYSTESHVQLKLTQSPFNIGLPLKLPPFTPEQMQELVRRHGLNFDENLESQNLLGELMELVGGHPYLFRLALYYLCAEGISLEQIVQQATTSTGIYSDHLRRYLAKLQAESELAAAFKQILSAPESVLLDSLLAYRLDSMGLIYLEGDRAIPSCQLYRKYFSEQLLEVKTVSNQRLQQLERENQELHRLSHYDSLTQIANRRYFDRALATEWKRAAREQSTLSLILLDIDHFKLFNDVYGHLVGDFCLQQIAQTIRESLKRPADLVARYGGEEFAIILPQTDASGAVAVAEMIREQVKALAIPCNYPNVGGLPDNIVTASLGVATKIPQPGDAPMVLVLAADAALYQSKRTGRDRTTLHQEEELNG